MDSIDARLASQSRKTQQTLRSLSSFGDQSQSTGAYNQPELYWGRQTRPATPPTHSIHDHHDDEDFAPKTLASDYAHDNMMGVSWQREKLQSQVRRPVDTFDEANCCIRVVGAPCSVYMSEIVNLCSAYGEVLNFKAMGESTVHIQFATSRSAEAAVSDLTRNTRRVGPNIISGSFIPEFNYTDPERSSGMQDDRDAIKRRPRRVPRREVLNEHEKISSASLYDRIQLWLRDPEMILNKVLISIFGNDIYEEEQPEK